MKRFSFYIDGIDCPKEFIKGFYGETRKAAYKKAEKKYGLFACYSPVLNRKSK